MRMKNIRRIGVGLAFLGALAAGPAWAANPPAADQSPVGGSGAHPHHVHLGNGGCIEIDAVLFKRESRGLHGGSEASGVDQGPYHGPCH